MPDPVPATQVRRARMVSLLLDAPDRHTPLEVARWFGAMQAQDVASGHWSLGVRCVGTTESDVLGAFERADLVRTWPMRGTIHVVPATDVRWMLDLTGVRTLTTAERRREQLGLSLADTDRAVAALDAALAGGRLLTRAEALAAIGEAGIDTSGQRGYHLLWYAAQTGVACIGPQRGTAQTFARLDDWAPVQLSLSRSEAVAELLLRYVRGHGPVSLRDFAGWSGLTLADARAGAAANVGRLVPLADGPEELWATSELAEVVRDGGLPAPHVVALPGFDELVLGYKDRALHVPADAIEQVVPGGNGVFRATVVVDGMAAATWTRTLRAGRVDVAVEPIRPLTRMEADAARLSFERYATFLGRDLRLTLAS